MKQSTTNKGNKGNKGNNSILQKETTAFYKMFWHLEKMDSEKRGLYYDYIKQNKDNIAAAVNEAIADILEKEDKYCMPINGKKLARYIDTAVHRIYREEKENKKMLVTVTNENGEQVNVVDTEKGQLYSGKRHVTEQEAINQSVLTDFFASLSGRELKAVTMYKNGYGYADIAKKIETTETNARQIVHRAIENFAKKNGYRR